MLSRFVVWTAQQTRHLLFEAVVERALLWRRSRLRTRGTAFATGLPRLSGCARRWRLRRQIVVRRFRHGPWRRLGQRRSLGFRRTAQRRFQPLRHLGQILVGRRVELRLRGCNGRRRGLWRLRWPWCAWLTPWRARLAHRTRGSLGAARGSLPCSAGACVRDSSSASPASDRPGAAAAAAEVVPVRADPPTACLPPRVAAVRADAGPSGYIGPSDRFGALDRLGTGAGSGRGAGSCRITGSGRGGASGCSGHMVSSPSGTARGSVSPATGGRGAGTSRGGSRCAHDIGLHHHVGRAADHHEMLDIVAPDQNQAAASVDGCRIDHGEPRLAPTRRRRRPGARRRSGAPARQSSRSERATMTKRNDEAVPRAACQRRTGSRTSLLPASRGRAV